MRSKSLPNLRLFRGVTFIELILVVAMLLIMVTAYGAVGSNFLARNRFQNSTNEVLSFIRTAQINAMSGKSDSRWGVKVTANQIVLFKGDSYSARDTVFDEAFAIPPGVTVTSSEVVFDKLTGNPSSTLSIVVTAASGEAATVSINEIGIANVN